MIRTGDVIHNRITGESIRFVETAADTDGERVVIDVLVEPNGFVASAHLHPYQTEVFEVVEGELTFKVGGETIAATAGESVTVEPGTAHKFWNASETAARFRCEITPGAPVRAADRDDVRARQRRQDEQEGPAEPAPPRRDREPPLRRRPAAVPARLDPEARARSPAPRPAACSATARPTCRPRPPTSRSRSRALGAGHPAEPRRRPRGARSG